MSEPSMRASIVLDGLEQMAAKILHAPPQPIAEGDCVRVRVAHDGGYSWRNGRVLEVCLDNFAHKKFVVVVNSVPAPIVLRVDEISVRRA